jgi:hypothetical protein
MKKFWTNWLGGVTGYMALTLMMILWGIAFAVALELAPGTAMVFYILGVFVGGPWAMGAATRWFWNDDKRRSA